MSTRSSNRRPETQGGASGRGMILLAFGCIYLIWGSTYLAIRFAVEAFPPFLTIGTRSLLAGAVLFGLAMARGVARPTARHWRRAALTGGLLFVTGQSTLAWVETFVDSGLAALVLAIIPVWMILLQLRQKRPGARAVGGVVLGLGGVAILVAPGSAGIAAVDPLGGVLLLACGLSWAIGSLASRSGLPSDSMMSTALQLVAGGALACVAGAAFGELGRVEASAFTARPLLAFAYLTVFGSLVTFSAYSWLLTRCEPASVGSYAFVNPAIAVLVGWAFGGEALSASVLLATGVIVAGVYLVVTSRPSSRRSPCDDPPCLEGPKKVAPATTV